MILFVAPALFLTLWLPMFIVGRFCILPARSTPQTSVSTDGDGNRSIEVTFQPAVANALLADISKKGPVSQAIAGRQRGFTGT